MNQLAIIRYSDEGKEEVVSYWPSWTLVEAYLAYMDAAEQSDLAWQRVKHLAQAVLDAAGRV